MIQSKRKSANKGKMEINANQRGQGEKIRHSYSLIEIVSNLHTVRYQMWMDYLMWKENTC